MSKQSSLMLMADRIARNIVADQTQIRVALGFDAAIIAANRALHLGPKRAADFATAYNDAIEELAAMFIDDCKDNNDKTIEYAKGKRDEMILRIVGKDNFAPFDATYGNAYVDELKRIRAIKENVR